MSLPKAQLVDPQGNMNLPGMTATGVVTATSLKGDITGSATALTGNPDLDVGIVTASSFVGQGDGHAANITGTPQLNLGITTATSFVGDATGKAAGLTGTPNLNVGLITATSFVGFVTGNVTGNVSGNITGLAGSVASGANIHIGVITATSYSGDGQYLTGIAATNYNTQTVPGSTFSIDVGNSGSSAYTLSGTDRNGSVSGSNASVSVEVGDTLNFVVDASGHPFYIRVSDGGANVSTPAATNQGAQSGTVSWTPNTAGTYYYQCGNHSGMIGTITVTATSTIDLSAGNLIKFTQPGDTTIAFANTSTAMSVTILRQTGSSGSITWPDSVKWNGGSAPTLLTGTQLSTEAQQFQLLTRDTGVTWYAWENMKSASSVKYNLFTWGCDEGGTLGHNEGTNTKDRSSPTQVAGVWSHINVVRGQKLCVHATKPDGTLWFWGNGADGMSGMNSETDRSSPIQVGTDTTWSLQNLGASEGAVYSTKTDGTLWTWGNNGFGRLGLNQPHSTKISSPAQIPGTDWATSLYSMTREGNQMCGAVKTDGTLWVWGINNEGILGLNQPTTSYKSSPTQIPGTTWNRVSGGNEQTSAIKTDGTLWTWGRNYAGTLGLNQSNPSPGGSRSSPTQVGTDTNWANISSGGYRQSFAVKTDGTGWSWGYGYYGSMGTTPSLGGVRISSPTQIDGEWNQGTVALFPFTIATKADGTLWAWGRNNDQGGGNLGQNDRTNVGTPVQIPGTTWRYVWGAFAASYALKDAE